MRTWYATPIAAMEESRITTRQKHTVPGFNGFPEMTVEKVQSKGNTASPVESILLLEFGYKKAKRVGYNLN